MSERVQSAVKFFNEKKGFGFITRDDGQGEVFVHVAETLFEGDKLTFEVQSVKKGLQGSPTARSEPSSRRSLPARWRSCSTDFGASCALSWLDLQRAARATSDGGV
jgi:CspA family cold shock protein